MISFVEFRTGTLRCTRACKAKKTKFAELAFLGTLLTEIDRRKQRERQGIVIASEDKDITSVLLIRAVIKVLAFSRH
jgi:hypothetical protein